MKKRSLRSSIIILTSIAILVSTIAIMLVAIVGIHAISDRSAAQIMRLLDKENAANMNNSIMEVEQAVDTMAAFSQDSEFGLGSDLNRLFVDSDYRSEFLGKAKELAKAEMSLTENSSSVYCQLSIEITGSSTNFQYVRDAGSGEIMEGLPIEVTNFESSDIEHVGWYFEPKNNKKAMWIGPYKNRNYGHIINVFRESDGTLVYYDPQSNKTLDDFGRNEFFRLMNKGKSAHTAMQLLRIDNLQFNKDIVDYILARRNTEWKKR